MNVFFETLAKARSYMLHCYLGDAADRGILSVVKTLVEDLGADLDYYWGYHGTTRTVISVAAMNGHLDLVEYLLNAGVDLHSPLHVNTESSPLVAAAFHGQTQVEKYLIDRGAHLGSPENVNVGYLTSTAWERGGGIPDLLLRMVDITPFVDSKDPEKRPWALHWAILSGNEPLLFQVVQHGSFQDFHILPLSVCMAAQCGSASMTKAMVEMLVQVKPDPPHEDDPDPFDWDTMDTKADIIEFNPKLLLPLFEDHIVDLNLSRGRGSSARQVCLDGAGSPDVSTYFLDRGLGFFSRPLGIVGEIQSAFCSDKQDFKSIENLLRHTTLNPLDQFRSELGVGFTTCKTSSLLQIAASTPSFEKFTKYLEMTGLKLDPSNEVCCEALATAVEARRPEIVRYFLDKGFDVNRTYQLEDPRQGLPRPEIRDVHLLYLAIYSHQYHNVWEETSGQRYEKLTSVVQDLLDHGAKLDAPGPCNRTPLALAIKRGEFDLCRLLIERGANPTLGFEKGTSAIQEMVKAGTRRTRVDEGDTYPGLKSAVEALFGSIPHEMARSQCFLQSFIDYGQDLLSICECRRCSMTDEEGIDHNAPSFHWNRFLVTKAIRQRYWRAQFPVPSVDQ